MSFSRSTAISWIAAKAISPRSALSLRGVASREAKDTMNRLYVVENRFTLTGAMADHRLRCPASQIPGVHSCARRKIAAATKDAGLSSMLATLKAPRRREQFDEHWLTEAANDLCRNRARVWSWPARINRSSCSCSLTELIPR